MEKKRPGIITAVCIIGFIGVIFAIPMVLSEGAQRIGPWYPPYLAFSALVGLICMVGLWMMKKWSIITYTTFAGINQVVLLAMGYWNIFALILPGIVIAIGLWKYQLME